MTEDHAHGHGHGHGHGAGPAVGEEAGLNPFLEGWLERLQFDGAVLDLGCGHGFWTRYMADQGVRVVGLEPGADRINDAAGQAHAPVVDGDGASLPFRDAAFSLVWCIHVLHHLHNPVRVLAEVRRVLRPGGHLVLAETVEDNPAIRLGRRVHPEWDGVPIRSRFTAAALTGLLAQAGLLVIDRRQHSLVSFAAWSLPRPDIGRRAWNLLSGLEDRLPGAWTSRWGAHLDCVARRP